MVLLESKPLELGQEMGDFALFDADGHAYTRDRLMGEKGLLVIFSCNHCPYAVAVWPRLNRLAELATELGISTVAINPNIHPDYPEDSPDLMPQFAARMGITFPYLVDDDQTVARKYEARCTPDMYLLDQDANLVYHGRIDDNWKDETAVTKHELKEAIEALADGRPISDTQFPSIGCSIKWQ